MESNRVVIDPTFVKELIYCVKYNGNFKLFRLAAFIRKEAENFKVLCDYFESDGLAEVVEDVRNVHDKAGMFQEDVDNLLFWASRTKRNDVE